MRIGLLGAGTVGSSLLALLVQHEDDLRKRLGEPLEVAAVVVRDGARPRRLSMPAGAVLTTDAGRVVDDPEVEIVVEAMGGLEPARTYALRALGRGADWVSANKALVAGAGPELFRAAAASGADLRFEAAVGAAVPVVGTLQDALGAARVLAIAGVLNGSTNFILARMAAGDDAAAAIERARALGYLEADAADDLDGYDAARKIAILASLAGGRHLAPEGVAVRGVGGLTGDDLQMAAALGCEVKLLAVAERAEDGFAAWVAPALVPATSPLAAVRGAANAVLIASIPGGETLVAGQGAGGAPTASALAGDLLAAARRRRAGGRGPTFAWREAPASPPAPPPRRHVMRVVTAGAKPPDLAAVPGVRGVAAQGEGWTAVATEAMDDARVAEVRRRLRAVAGVREVGVALTRWRAERAEGEEWWRPPVGEAWAAAAREGALA
ncbi:MAG: homoserine dehydrogenase [Firmicutes bacterium]|nr:homoserine dehydrogenase [Bacillota bacterium]